MLLITFRYASLVAQRVKRLPAMWETRVRSLGWEDPLEKKFIDNPPNLGDNFILMFTQIWKKPILLVR